VGPSPSASGLVAEAPRIGQWHELLWHAKLERVVLVNGPETGGRSGDPLELWAWARLAADPDAPAWRNFGTAAYDPARDVIVVQGGSVGATSPSDETWEWDGAAWRLVTRTGPGAREGAGMDFDPVSRRMILFGGGVGGRVLADTWAFDGSTWSRLMDSGPRARFPAAFTATPDGLLLYGGHVLGDPNQISIGDTWLWDGETWTEAATFSAPGSRVNVGAAMDPRNGRLLLIGGGSSDDSLGDVWAWDGADWTEVDDDAFPARQGHRAAFDRRRNVVVVTGGLDRPGSTSPLQDVWEWSGSGPATKVFDPAA
jgi:hypothetical protein